MADETPTLRAIGSAIWPPLAGGRTPTDAPEQVLSSLRTLGWLPPDETRALRSRLTEVERQRDDKAFSANEADLDRIYVQRLLTGALVERDEAQAERDRMLPVVEAAKAYGAAQTGLRSYRAHTNPELDDLGPLADALHVSRESLLAAVDLYSSTVHPPTPETPK